MGAHSYNPHDKVKVAIECTANKRSYIKILLAKTYLNFKESLLSLRIHFPRKPNKDTLQAPEKALNGRGVDCDSLEDFWEQTAVKPNTQNCFFLLAMFFLLYIVPIKAFSTPCDQNSTVPVIFIPGYAASLPIKGQALSYIFNRGFSPEKLQLSFSYDTLVRTLKRAGYKKGKTFFGAVFDWRMPVAPQDGNFDGILEQVTAQSMTSGDYSFAVNYLGYWLDQAIQANPNLKYVDVVTHSTGGIVARAYIQSPAYGATYIDKHGITRQLPRIRYLVAGAMPSEGTIHSWRPWNGDFQDVLSGFIPTSEIEARFCAFAFAKVLLGGKIYGPDYIITRESILQVDKKGRLIPDQTLFFRLYNPMRRSLMSTDNFLQTPDSESFTNVNDDLSLRSDILLDLNAQSSPGNNPWLSLIGTASGKGGAIATYATGARKKTSILDFVVPGLINNNPFISTLTKVIQLSNNQGSFLPLLELLNPTPTLVPIYDSLFSRIGDSEVTQQLAGDGNGTFETLLSTFVGDPKITLVQWGNGTPPSNIPIEIVWTKQTSFPVYHDVFFFNPDVAAFVASTLTGKQISPKPLSRSSVHVLLTKQKKIIIE